MSAPTLNLRPQVEGNATGETLFFVQGWPDDHTLWNDQVAALRDRYRCVRVDMPNYPDGEQRRWGYDHDTIAEALAACIRSVSPDRPVTLIAHDWGAYWAYVMHHRHPELVSRLVGLDIAPSVKPKPHEAVLIAAYQWWLTAAFVAGGRAGDWMTRIMAGAFGAPQPQATHASLNYPYFYVWRDILTGRRARQLAGYRPEVPVLYVYGARKAVQFHSARWLEHVRSRPGSEVVALPNAAHWVMRDPDFTRVLSQWLDTSLLTARGQDQRA
jgi:pimeloyl-ACP methyl ester carboxylesterase